MLPASLIAGLNAQNGVARAEQPQPPRMNGYGSSTNNSFNASSNKYQPEAYQQPSYSSKPPRVLHTPSKNEEDPYSRKQPYPSEKPSGSGFGGGGARGGLSIYELAAMQASPDSMPNNTDVPVEDEVERVACRSCGRQFSHQAIVKHEKVCQKVFVQKRKAFDTKAQRKPEGAEEI